MELIESQTYVNLAKAYSAKRRRARVTNSSSTECVTKDI